MDFEACASEIYEKLFDGERRSLKHLEVFTIENVIRDHYNGTAGFSFKPRITISRRDDMSQQDTLDLIRQPDGDIIVTVFKPGKMIGSVEFCSVGAGGGRSPRTRAALEMLARAIALDNRDRPDAKGNRDDSASCFEQEAPR